MASSMQRVQGEIRQFQQSIKNAVTISSEGQEKLKGKVPLALLPLRDRVHGQAAVIVGKMRQFRRCIWDVVSICTCCYMAKWLWDSEREYGSLHNTLTIVYGVVCLLWTPRFTQKNIVYSFFAGGVFGFLMNGMWLTDANQEYLEWWCKPCAVIFAAQSARQTWGLISLYHSGEIDL